MFSGKVVKNESTDPNYKIKFSFENEEIAIIDGEALFTRKSPLPVIIFDNYTDNILKQASKFDDSIKKIELELGKTVIEYIIKSTKDPNNLSVSRSFPNNGGIRNAEKNINK